MSTIKLERKNYDGVSAMLHWSIAVLIPVALISGFAAGSAGEQAHAQLRVHIVTGILAAGLTLARIAWWMVKDTRLAPAPNSEGAKGVLARVVHILLTVIPLSMAASGIGMMLLSGAGEQLLAGPSAPLPNFGEYLPRIPHGIGGRLIMAMVLLHVAAALYHHYLLRDGLIRRMWPFESP